MPLFDFKCKNCGKVSEFLISKTDEVNSLECPFCNYTEFEKVLSMPAEVKVKEGGHSMNGKNSGCCGMSNPCDNQKRCCTK